MQLMKRSFEPQRVTHRLRTTAVAGLLEIREQDSVLVLTKGRQSLSCLRFMAADRKPWREIRCLRRKISFF